LETALQRSQDEQLEDIRANMSDLLWSACENGALESALSSALQDSKDDRALEDIRLNMSNLLWSACESGALESALTNALQDERSLEDIRLNMSDLLWNACETGALESALSGALQDSKEDSLEDIRANMSSLLWSACESGHLEQALGSMKASASTPMKPTYLGTPSPPVKPSSGMKTSRPAVELAIEAMSLRDRRIGELSAMIKEAKQQLIERDECCRAIEGKLGAARIDLAHLDLDMEWHRRALDDAQERSNELEAGQRKLIGELDGHQQKFRHAKIEAEESCLMSARSELSTATGGATAASSLGCFTPQKFSYTAGFDPVVLTTPSAPNRW
jgi:hypothetical protein